jgi:hypothetical protein
MPTRIVTHAYRPKRQPRKKKVAAIATPIVKASSKAERFRRREEADKAEVSPEELAKAEAFLARMMRPRE